MTVPLVTGAPQFASFRLYDAEEVRAFYANEYHAGNGVGVGEPAPGRRFAVAADQLFLGPIEITEHRLTVDIAVGFERDDVYVLCVTSSGTLVQEQRGVHVTGDPRRASMYRPAAGPAVIRTLTGGRRSRTDALIVKNWAVAAELELLLDRPVPSTLAFAPLVELASPESHGWLRLLGLFTDALRRRDPTILQPIVAEPLCHALLTGLLLVSDHPYSDMLRQPAATCRPRHVKLALDAMHEHPEQPHTSGSLAQLAGVSVRNLQEGFRRNIGVPPMTYLRQLRLARAHHDLHVGRVTTVAEAAQRWGFAHLGRFAAAYRVKYGALPSAVRGVPPAEAGEPS